MRTSFFLPYLREPASKLKTSPVQLSVAVCNAFHFLPVSENQEEEWLTCMEKFPGFSEKGT